MKNERKAFNVMLYAKLITFLETFSVAVKH